MALAVMQKANLDAVKPDVYGKIKKQSVQLDEVVVTRARSMSEQNGHGV